MLLEAFLVFWRTTRTCYIVMCKIWGNKTLPSASHQSVSLLKGPEVCFSFRVSGFRWDGGSAAAASSSSIRSLVSRSHQTLLLSERDAKDWLVIFSSHTDDSSLSPCSSFKAKKVLLFILSFFLLRLSGNSKLKTTVGSGSSLFSFSLAHRKQSIRCFFK